MVVCRYNRTMPVHPSSSRITLKSLAQTAFVGLALCLAACSKAPEPGGVTDALWSARLYDLKDRATTAAEFRGRPLVVNFWARWCPPCRAEIPDLAATRSQFANQGVEFLGIALEPEGPPVAEFAQQHGVNYPMLLAKEQGEELMATLGNHADSLPFTVVIDRRGNIVARKVGRISRSEAEAAVRAAIE